MPRVIHFELPVENIDRAAAFYSSVFGWTVQKWDGPMPYWLLVTGSDGEGGEPGINGALTQSGGVMPPRTPVNTIGVASVDEYTAKITAAGGRIAMPKMAVAGVGYLAYCVDTEGVLFGIIEPDTSATD